MFTPYQSVILTQKHLSFPHLEIEVDTVNCGREIEKNNVFWVQLIFPYEVIVYYLCAHFKFWVITAGDTCSFLQLLHAGTQKVTEKVATYQREGSNNIWELGWF